MTHLMRALVFGTAMAVAFPGCATAQAPETQLLKTARAALRAGLIEPTCGPFYLIDRKQIAEVRLAITRDAIDRFGTDPFLRAIQDVQPELSAELKDGAAIWCPKQRAAYRKIGLPGLIGGNLP